MRRILTLGAAVLCSVALASACAPIHHHNPPPHQVIRPAPDRSPQGRPMMPRPPQFNGPNRPAKPHFAPAPRPHDRW